jgi:hypothetical protein
LHCIATQSDFVDVIDFTDFLPCGKWGGRCDNWTKKKIATTAQNRISKIVIFEFLDKNQTFSTVSHGNVLATESFPVPKVIYVYCWFLPVLEAINMLLPYLS